MKKIFAISGSTRAKSANLQIIHYIQSLTKDFFQLEIFKGIEHLPHFNPDLTKENLPQEVLHFHQKIINADIVLICTPEYVFSLPGSLKNALEWTVATTIFSNKVLGLITAAASGTKAHEELKLIMQTLQGNFDEKTAILIQGIKGKFDENGQMIDKQTENLINHFILGLQNNIQT